MMEFDAILNLGSNFELRETFEIKQIYDRKISPKFRINMSYFRIDDKSHIHLPSLEIFIQSKMVFIR